MTQWSTGVFDNPKIVPKDLVITVASFGLLQLGLSQINRFPTYKFGAKVQRD